jgi:hypothetical protein
MIERLASGRAGLRVWARRRLMPALPLPLLALAAAAFALAPSGISQRAGVRPDERLLPPIPAAASLPAPAVHARVAVAGAPVPGDEHAPSRPRRAGKRRRVEP